MGKPNYIYIGPNIGPIGLKRNTIFRGDQLPQKFKELADRKPVLRSLFISTRDLAEAQKKLTKKGTLEYVANQEVLAIAKAIPR